MMYRVVLAIEHLPDDPDNALDNERPIVDENVHTLTVLALEHSFSAANATFKRINDNEESIA